jgi:hypothetical protein
LVFKFEWSPDLTGRSLQYAQAEAARWRAITRDHSLASNQDRDLIRSVAEQAGSAEHQSAVYHITQEWLIAVDRFRSDSPERTSEVAKGTHAPTSTRKSGTWQAALPWLREWSGVITVLGAVMLFFSWIVTSTLKLRSTAAKDSLERA